MTRVSLWLALLVLLSFATAAVAEERKSTAGPGVQVLAPLAMPGLGRSRTIRVYLPPGYATGERRYPVLYMHDGQNLFDDATSFVGEWGVDEAMDALAKEHGLELIVVGVDHGDAHRIHELSPWTHPKYGEAQGREYLRFVVEVVKPHIDAAFRTKPGRGHTAIMGSSLGALASHYAAFEYPQVFGRIGEFSPSYWFAPAAYELSRKQRLPKGTRMLILAGDKEGDEPARTVADTERMIAELRLQQPGLRLRGEIRAGGEHNERFWRAEFPRAVLFLFGRD